MRYRRKQTKSGRVCATITKKKNRKKFFSSPRGRRKKEDKSKPIGCGWLFFQLQTAAAARRPPNKRNERGSGYQQQKPTDQH